jgi:beta-N-acetylhexosaminidase
VRREALLCAKALKEFNLNLNLAPVLDLAGKDAPGFLRARTFGEDPSKVAYLGRIYIETLLNEGLLCCAKHFPGLGGVELDPHQGLPVISHLSREALLPFDAAVRAGVPAVMTTHLVVEELSPEPATFSPEVVHLLREKIGFRGLVLTDDLSMGAIAGNWSLKEAILRAFLAGHDLVLLCQDFPQAIAAIGEFLEEAEQSPSLRKILSEALTRVKSLLTSMSPRSTTSV